MIMAFMRFATWEFETFVNTNNARGRSARCSTDDISRRGRRQHRVLDSPDIKSGGRGLAAIISLFRTRKRGARRPHRDKVDRYVAGHLSLGRARALLVSGCLLRDYCGSRPALSTTRRLESIYESCTII